MKARTVGTQLGSKQPRHTFRLDKSNAWPNVPEQRDDTDVLVGLLQNLMQPI